MARVLSTLFDPSARVPGDDFFVFIHQGYIAPWTTAAHHQNDIVGAAAAAAGRLATGGYTVIYDGVVTPRFLEPFGAATGLTRIHYLMLLPPERVCIDRVRSRIGHGFTDLDAARHMYREFADSDIHDQHVTPSAAPAQTIASSIANLVLNESIIWTIDEADSRRG